MMVVLKIEHNRSQYSTYIMNNLDFNDMKYQKKVHLLI